MHNRSPRLHKAWRVFLQTVCGVIAAILLFAVLGCLPAFCCGTAAAFTLTAAFAAAACAALTES